MRNVLFVSSNMAAKTVRDKQERARDYKETVYLIPQWESNPRPSA